MVHAVRKTSRQNSFAKHFTVEFAPQAVFVQSDSGNDRWVTRRGENRLVLCINVGQGRDEQTVLSDIIAGFAYLNNVKFDSDLYKRFAKIARITRDNQLNTAVA